MLDKLLRMLTSILLSVLCLTIVTVISAPVLSMFAGIGNIFVEIIKENSEEAKNYVKGENKVTNALGESYTVKYKETSGFPDQGLDIVISSNLTLLKYSTDYDGLTIVPNRILRLFCENDTEYYFVGSEKYDFIFAYDTRARNGKRLNFKQRDALTEEQAERIHSQNLEIAETLRRNITRGDLSEKFRSCGYDNELALKIYDYK